jgi:hypothetical protein
MKQQDKKEGEKESVCVTIGQAGHNKGKKKWGSRTSIPKGGRKQEGRKKERARGAT